MKVRFRFAVLALALFAAVLTIAGGAGDPAAPIRQFIDGFNSGNMQSAFAAYATGYTIIDDELAPHLWTGPDAAHQWADA